MNTPSYFFTHISKNAGTSIESHFQTRSILIGRHDPFYSDYGLHWHTPPLAFGDELQLAFYNYVKEKKIFMVHRSPFDRVLSEMNCKWGNPHKQEIQSSKNKFNLYLRKYLIGVFLKRIHNVLHVFAADIKLIPTGGIGDHWTPQSHYLKSFRKVNNMVTIIPFDYLNEGIAELIEEHTRLPKLNEQHSSFKFQFSDISPLNKLMIFFIYLDDVLNHRSVMNRKSVTVSYNSCQWWFFSLNSAWAR